MLTQWNNFLWSAIALLYQLVLLMVLLALILGDAAGVAVNSVYGNVREFLATLNPAAVGVAAVLYLFWQMHKSRITGPSA